MGKFHGLGVLKVGGVLFEGEFSDGRIHGKGELHFNCFLMLNSAPI